MKIVLAPDKFKNSLTGLEFCDAVKDGIHKVNPNAQIIKLPLADGGDGTIEVVNYYLKGDVIKVVVNNPFFEPIKASYLLSGSTKTAFIEMAEASGVKLLKREALDCKNATTLGTGELILDAIKSGVENIILGIGGSATNDCGIGMATALGYRFLDKQGREVLPIGANLGCIETIDSANVLPELKDINFTVACDVSNPLYGKDGAAHVYAKQKGASGEDIDTLDRGLKAFSEILELQFKIDVQLVKGAGAAGGMGIASKVFLNGALKSGIELIKDLAKFDDTIEGADWVITGEGKLDAQTLSGKTLQGVLSSAKLKNIKVAAFCGVIDLPKGKRELFGIDYADMVDSYAVNKVDAMRNGQTYLKKIAEKFAKTIS
ncbi:glycerate kinase [Cognatitamlana onchidii]|uniref:glycerate kinase n=1 Tax=Cognatitamlana onchidii TaxID=2562860 RepID=UPI0010A5D9DA|nr:glycerate kinase [Algibacter onchidii]